MKNVESSEKSILWVIKRYLKKNPHVPYVAPAMICMVLLSIFPIVFLILLSTTNYHLGSQLSKIKFIGFDNYMWMFTKDLSFSYTTLMTIIFMIVATLAMLILGMASALLINFETRWKATIIGCLIIPIVITPSIISQVWKLIFNSEFGVLNYLLKEAFGISVVWLNQKNALLSVFISTIWISTPFVTLVLYSGLRSLPVEPYESARIDGANHYQIFMRITLPLLKPLIALIVLMKSIDLMKFFDMPYSLTQGGPGTVTEFLGLRIYRLLRDGTMGRASAYSVLLITFTTAICLVLIRIMRRREL